MRVLCRLAGLAAAVLLAAGLTTGVAALNVPQRIKALHPRFAGELAVMELAGRELPPEQLGELEVYAGDELRIYLAGRGSEALFLDQNGAPVQTPDVTMARLRAADIALEWDDSAGVIETAELAYGAKTDRLASAAPYIRIAFAGEPPILEDVAFSCGLRLTIGGAPQPQTELTLAGVLRVPVTDVWPGDTEANLQDGRVALARGDIASISVQAGDGVIVTTYFRRGERYYCVARLESESAENGDLLRVYALYSVGVDRWGARVRIAGEETLHVYDTENRYLGTTRDELPYSDHYYVTNRRQALL